MLVLDSRTCGIDIVPVFICTFLDFGFVTMPATYLKNHGSQQHEDSAFARQSGTWRRCQAAGIGSCMEPAILSGYKSLSITKSQRRQGHEAPAVKDTATGSTTTFRFFWEGFLRFSKLLVSPSFFTLSNSWVAFSEANAFCKCGK